MTMTIKRSFSTSLINLSDNNQANLSENIAIPETVAVPSQNSAQENQLKEAEKRIDQVGKIVNDVHTVYDDKQEKLLKEVNIIVDKNISDLSDETSSKLNKYTNEYTNYEKEHSDRPYELRAREHMFVDKVIDTLKADSALPSTVARELDVKKEENIKLRKDLDILGEYNIHFAEEEDELKEMKNKKEDSNKSGSLIDDYADVSTEMPSYMDPED